MLLIVIPYKMIRKQILKIIRHPFYEDRVTHSQFWLFNHENLRDYLDI